jgi:hypothetical protein
MKLFSGSIFCLFLLSSAVFHSQSKYSDVYRVEFSQAIQFYNLNKKQFEKAATKVKLKPEFVFSIVAPEISQYSSVYNEVELYSLKVMYTQFGKDYSDFSVGYFQMKPSFVESLENYISQNPKQFKDYIYSLNKYSFLFFMEKKELCKNIKDGINSLNQTELEEVFKMI